MIGMTQGRMISVKHFQTSKTTPITPWAGCPMLCWVTTWKRIRSVVGITFVMALSQSYQERWFLTACLLRKTPPILSLAAQCVCAAVRRCFRGPTSFTSARMKFFALITQQACTKARLIWFLPKVLITSPNTRYGPMMRASSFWTIASTALPDP